MTTKEQRIKRMGRLKNQVFNYRHEIKRIYVQIRELEKQIDFIQKELDIQHMEEKIPY